MIRLSRSRWVATALALLLASCGCRSPRVSLQVPVTSLRPSSQAPSTAAESRTAAATVPAAPAATGIQQVSGQQVADSSVTLSADSTSTAAAVVPEAGSAASATDAVRPEPAGADTQRVPPADQTVQAIDLPTALALTSGRSPQVAYAQARIAESQAQSQRADALWLPSLRAGANYNKHEGRIQDVAGSIIETSRGSVYSGAGAGAVGAGSPAVPGVLAQFHVTDAVFQPKIAQATVRARHAQARATANDSLLATALAYMQLLRAAQERAIAESARQQAQELERVTGEFATAGQGLTSDHDRARAELALRQTERQRAEEGVQVAAAHLAQQIRWEYAERLEPADVALHPISLVDMETPAQGLVAVGLTHRPEIAESRHLICEAIERLNREKYAPLIPSVLLGVSYGGMAGGLGGDLIGDGDRLDADAMAWWELRQLGFGEQAARREASARIVQTRTRQVAIMDQVAREIVETHAQVQSRALQIRTAEAAVSAAGDSFARNWERIQNGQGLPIEVLQSIQALTTARREYARAIADYNVAQFSLQRALGWPIDGATVAVSTGSN